MARLSVIDCFFCSSKGEEMMLKRFVPLLLCSFASAAVAQQAEVVRVDAAAKTTFPAASWPERRATLRANPAACS